MRRRLICRGVWTGLCVAVLGALYQPVCAEGLALGPWQAEGGVYRAAAPNRILYYFTDRPYVVDEGTAEATVVVKRRTVSGGWGAAALLLSSDPQSFWTLSLVDGPDGQRYTELIESYQSVHQAQSTGPTRVAPIEGAFAGSWEYGRSYRLRLTLSRDRIVGEVFEAGKAEPITRLGWLLAGAAAVRDGWAALREEQFDAEFSDVKVTAPATPTPGAAARSYPQAPQGCVGLYFGEDLPGAEKPPAVDRLNTRLKAAGFATVALTSTELATPGTLAFPGLRCLVADLRRLPAAGLPLLTRWMQQGGILVSATSPAFGSFFWRAGDRWLTWDEHSQHGLEDLGRDARPFVMWSDAALADWHEGLGGKVTSQAAKAIQPGRGPNGQDALELTVPHFDSGWWSLGRKFDAPPAREGERLTCFWARGDAKTAEVSLEWTEDDGARWISVISLEPSWRYYVLPPQAFQYWPDNPSKGRGGPGDGLRLEHAVGMAWGLSGSHTPIVLGADAREHHVSFGPLAFAKATPEALAGLAPVARPELEALSPGYKFHEIRDQTRWEPTDSGRLLGVPSELAVADALGAVERPGGEGFDRGRWWRWIPLVQARDGRGRSLGAPMSVLLSETLPMPRCAWISLGLRRLEEFARPGVQEATAAALSRLVSGPVFFEAGTSQFLLRPQDELRLGARVASFGAQPGAAEVRFHLTRAGSERAIVADVTLSATTAPRGMSVLRSSLKPLPEGEYRVTAELLQGGRVIDRIAHPFSVRAPLASPPAAGDVVRREGGRLLLDGKPWHPVAANYWPHCLGGIPGGAYSNGWFEPMLYNPELAEADLAQMESWGFRALAAIGADVGWDPTPDSPTLRNLEDFLWRCHRHHIKVIFFCRGLDPRGRDDDVACGLIRAIRYHPALAGYDIAWEPGYWGARQAYDRQWRDWLREHYGSVEEAERIFGQKLPRDPKGEAQSPPDEWCEQDGPWHAATAAYRTYWNWQLGAEYRRSATLVRSLDPVHLIGFRGSNVTSPLNFKPVEQPAVLHFMDWAGPEGYDVPAYGRLTPWPDVSNRGLCTRMLSFISGRKPVVWMEFGMPVYPNGTTWHDELTCITPERYAYQAEEGRRWWQMQVDSGAWGSFVWWYPGGFRVGENSDCGLVDPNNVPRPVADTVRRFVPEFAGSERYEPDAWLDFRPEANVGGWVGEYLRLRDDYARLVAQHHRVDVRTAGLTMTSADCPLLDPAGQPWAGKGPLRYLDAIFERVGVRCGGEWQDVPLPTKPQPVEIKLPAGGPVEIEAWAGSLAEARWLTPGEAATGGVRLTVAGEVTAQSPLEKAVPFQGSGHFAPVRVADRLAGPLKLRLQLQAEGRADLGEVLTVSLVPGP